MPVVSDFGFDGYALDGAGLHPLEIARDLIGAGKPRSALEVLSLHYDAHADDREYLLLCAEAWRATGDPLRAQRALVGAARLAPTDPRPLHMLSELLAERGERERAERMRAKARALEEAGAGETPSDEVVADPGEDLIAAAEQKERGHRAAPSRRHVLGVVLGLAGLALLVAAIALMADSATEQEPSADPATARSELAVRTAPAEPEVPASTTEPAQAVGHPALTTETVIDAEPPVPDPASGMLVSGTEPKPTADQPVDQARRARPVQPQRRSGPSPAREQPVASTSPVAPEPDAASVRAELRSTSPEQLTARADALYAQGHTALALTYYRRALEIDPDYAPALVGMGRGILRAERYDEAMTNATRALQLARGVDARPGLEAEAIYQMARVQLARGERDAAQQLLRQAVSSDGAPEEAWFYLGEALASENSRAARGAYRKYLELVPNGSLAARARRAIR
jgi:tetratricopeptide (TPR) repeat protein